MQIIRHFNSLPKSCRGATVALGNFDGVHLGHQAILSRVLEIAEANRTRPAVMTFEPHPREFFARGGQKLRLYSLRRKIELLRDAGIEILYLARFNQAFAAMTPESFINDLLYKKLGVRHVVTGYNFAFGSNRQGSTDLLQASAQRWGFGFTACPPVADAKGEAVSSSAIRTALSEGRIRKASGLLGQPYSIEGRVIKGTQRGKSLGFPTANISLNHLFKPRFGIYAVRVAFGSEGTWHDGVASLGIRPTFGAFDPLLEVHVFDMDRGLYGQRARVQFVEFIREEKRFDTAELLQTQMRADDARARELLNACR